MHTSAGQELVPIHATIQLDGPELVVFLTDCRSLNRQARGPYDELLFRRLSEIAGADGSAGPGSTAATSLYAWLFPGSCGEFLRRSPPRLLNLQLAPELDFLMWECASDGAAFLGAKFCVTRHLMADDEGVSAPVVAQPGRSGPLQVLLLQAGEPAAGGVPQGDAGEASVIVRSLGVPAELPEATRVALAQADVLYLGDVWRMHTPAQLQLASWPERPRLLVARVGESEAHHDWVRSACDLGWALLALRADQAGEQANALLGEIGEQLACGHSIAEATRSARLVKPCQRALATARLYGLAATRFVEPNSRGASEYGARQVTTLSFDVVNSTGLMRQLGDERYADLLSALHERCAAIVRRHGGVSDAPQGDDGIMCYFGHPIASENAAENAVLAGLKIAEAQADARIIVRVGIATGWVTVRAGQPFSPSIHLAARLQKAAMPGTVWVCGTTRALVAHRFETQELARQPELKGIEQAKPKLNALKPTKLEPVCVVRVLPGGAKHRLDTLPRLTPFVGRDDELARLSSLWEAAQKGQACLAWVSGEAGIGKSRLVREFRQMLKQRNQDLLECRCLPDSSVSAFHALALTLRLALGLQDDDAPATGLAKIAQGLPAGLQRDDAVPLIAALVSVPYASHYPEPKGTPERLRQRTLSTMVDCFRHAARAAPICLVVEDVHWVDPSTREFLSQLLAQSEGLPLMVIVTQRDEADAGWRPAMACTPIVLRGLPAQASRTLVMQACGDGSLPTGVVRLLAARADGVPLFLEESARMALELSADGEGGDQPPLQLDVPPTLQGLLMARLDRLRGAKTVAQLGAVLGREFPESLLRSVVAQGAISIEADELPLHLATLVESGLLLRNDSPTDTRYAFKHALVRDTAYQSLWGRDRQRIHRMVDAAIREHWPEMAERQPELLAHHQAEAGLHAEALVQWETAARRAASRSAHDESISHLRSALRLLAYLPEGAERDRIELRLQLLLASCCIATEGYGAEQVERVYGAAARLSDKLGDSAARLKFELGLEGYHFMRADFAVALGFAERATVMAEQSPEPMHRLQARWAVANILFHQGELTSALRRMDECLADYRPEMHRPGAVQDPGVMCLCYSAWGQWQMGRPDDALERIHRVRELATALDHKFSLAEACAFATSVHHFRGETEAALACVEQCLAICEERGFSVWLAHAHVMRGRLLCEQGQAQAGVAEMRKGYALWVRTGAVVTRPFYLALQAEGLACAGEPGQGLELLDQAMQLAHKYGERYYEAEVRRLTAELRLQHAAQQNTDCTAEAEHWLLGAHDLARQQRMLGFALRSATSLARLWGGCGREREAVAMLKPLLEGWVEGRETRDVRVALAVLHGLGRRAAAVGDVA